MIKKNHWLIGTAALTLAVSISLFAIGFSAWNGIGQGDTKETTLSIEVDDVKYAGFDNLLSNNTIRFDAPTSDNTGRIVYTNDIGGEQLTIDVTGTILHYSQVGSVSITGSIDSNHLSTYNLVKNYQYIVEPVFEELTRKPTVLNPTSNGSYWTSDHDTINDTRDFEIIASFSWGSFFNYKNPSLFFDSTETNIENKSGNQYDEDSVKSILATIHNLNQAVYTINLSVTAFSYTVSFAASDSPSTSGIPDSISDIPAGGTFTVPSTDLYSAGYDFLGYSYTKNSSTAEYLKGETYNINDLVALDSTINAFTLYTVFSAKSWTCTITVGSNEKGQYSVSGLTNISSTSISAGGTAKPTVRTGDVITFTVTADSNYTAGTPSYTNLTKNGNNYTVTGAGTPSITVPAAQSSGGGECLLPDTLITLADGTYKAVKDISPYDTLLAYDHEKGELVASPMFYQFEAHSVLTTVTYLKFSNGKEVGVITSHGFYDIALHEYVKIDANNFNDYIGHSFYTAKLENDGFVESSAKLVSGRNVQMITDYYSPVSKYTFNSFCEDFLSIPDDHYDLVNFWQFDENMRIDLEQKEIDIARYGLRDYSEMSDYLSYEIFDAYNLKYLNISIARGYMTPEKVMYMITKYVPGVEKYIDKYYRNN